MATELSQRMADQVGPDGVQDRWTKSETRVCAQAFYNQVLAAEGAGAIPGSQTRDRREAETLCVAVDLFARGTFSGGCLQFSRR